MRRVAFTLVLLAAGAWPSFAQDWTPLTPLPQARQGAAGAALGESFFVIGGNSGLDLSRVDVWTETDGWMPASPMSTTRQYPGAAAAGGFVYAIGGLSITGMPDATVERFDPATNTWSHVAPLPSGKSLMGVAEWNGFVFVLGGEGIFGELLPEVLRYDPAANTWSSVAPIPTACSGPGAAVIGGEIYVVGGSATALLARVQIYDPAADAWRPGPDLPEPLWMPAVAAFEERIWVMGGVDRFFGRSDRVYSLGADGTWQTEGTLPQGLASSAVGSSGSRLVLAGGLDASGQPVSAALTRVGAAPPPPPPLPPPPAGDTLTVQAKFSPQTLNLKSRGHWVTVKLWAHGWNVADIDASALVVGGVAADLGVTPKMGEHEGVPCMTVKLPRSGFADLDAGEHALIVEASTLEHVAVRGEAQVRIVGADEKNQIARTPGPTLKPVPAGNTGRTGRPTATVALSLPSPQHVRIDVLDVQGRVVDRLANRTFGAGEHRVEWTGAQRQGPGIYFVRADVGGVRLASRMAVLR